MATNNKTRKPLPGASPEEFKALQTELKALDTQWVQKLVTQVQADPSVEEEYKTLTEKKIYNVFNGVVRNGQWRLLIYKQAGWLRDELRAAWQQPQ